VLRRCLKGGEELSLTEKKTLPVKEDFGLSKKLERQTLL